MAEMPRKLDKKVEEKLFQLAYLGINHAVTGLSQMIGDQLTALEPHVEFVPILSIPNLLGGPETEAAGIYLTASGEMSGQFMLILPLKKSLELVDLLMFDPPGTNKELDDMGRSALAEVGNLSGAFFLNSVAELTGMQTLPSPPVVIVDMVGAILNIIVATSAEQVDEVLLIQTRISSGERDVEASFWYIPDLLAMEKVAGLVEDEN
ncbi:MAG: chemotaxis protein CheC [Anaerolineaceae bacterium]|nr:chemotaxis protein CheC [Anaerolineaceae bacterium]